MKVLAVDPGERCGWAVGTIGQRPPDDGGEPVLTVEAHGILSLKAMALNAYRGLVVEQKYDWLVVESYRIRGDKLRAHQGSDVPTLQIIGMLRLMAWVSNTNLILQPPRSMGSARLSLNNAGGEDILERLSKMPKSHDDGHDGSALLHLWHFYFTRYY